MSQFPLGSKSLLEHDLMRLSRLQNKVKRYLIRMLPRPDKSDPVRYRELARLVRLHEIFSSISYP